MINKTKFERNKEKPIQKYRFYVQLAFVMICLWIGIEFYLFANYLQSGGAAAFQDRPPGAEGFLPISAMMSVYYFLLSGEIHGVHPAGFFIFLGIIAVSIVFGKSFCSWMCPVGFISELVGDFGEKIYKKLFKKRIKLPKYIDYPLRSIKYLLLFFFVYSIFFSMTELALKSFLDSSYNIIADVKMYYFFADISRFSIIVIASLFFLSIFIRNFWCRYLCPYGALLGISSLFSATKIKRNSDTCIDCSLCNKACPSFIKVDKVKTVFSDECSSCLSCVDACPVKNTLEVKSIFGKKKISKKYVAIGILVLYFLIIGVGMVSGYWKNDITKEEYLKLHKERNNIGHIRSSEDIKKLNKEALRGEKNDR